jgi:uncharacterized membrane protein
MATVLSRSSLHVLLLVVLVIVGSAARFHDLGRKSLWADELFTLRMALYHPLVPSPGEPWHRATSIYELRDGDTFWTAKAAEQHPPLQDLAEKASVNLLGLSEFSARVPGALASCLLLAWFAWFAARAADPWQRAALTWALLLLAFSPALIAYAKDARPYSLGASLVGMGSLLWLLRWRDGWRRVPAPGWGEILLLLLACFTHYNAAALVAVLLALDFFLAIRNRDARTLVKLVVLAVAFSLWLSLTVHTILATTSGSVAWAHYSALQNVFLTFYGAVTIAHAPWFALFLIALWAVVARHFVRFPQLPLPTWVARLFFLGTLILVYLALAGYVVAKAGMGHVRFYIFAMPLLAVAGAIMLAQLQRHWATTAAAVLILATAWPTTYSKELAVLEDFRAMTEAGIRGADEQTLFLYPWGPNRDHYRIYLERMLKQDVRARMVGVSTKEDVARVCAQLASAKHVAVMGHDVGKAIINDVYGACGEKWPVREKLQFHNTFAEHWRPEAGPATSRP